MTQQSCRATRINDGTAMLLFLPRFSVQRRGCPRFPVGEIAHHSNCEPACAVRCTGRTPPVGIVQHTGSAKPRTRARRRSLERGGSQTSTEDLGGSATPRAGPTCHERTGAIGKWWFARRKRLQPAIPSARSRPRSRRPPLQRSSSKLVALNTMRAVGRAPARTIPCETAGPVVGEVLTPDLAGLRRFAIRAM
jgi:hypothetical protein